MKRKLFISLIFIASVIVFTLFLNVNKAYAANTVEDGTYVISSALNDNLALDITEASTNDGANLEVWTKYPTQKNQQFIIKSDGNGYCTITAVNSNKVLDVYGNYKTKGTNVTQFKNNGQDNQKWKLVDAGNGYFYIESKSTGLNLDIYGGYNQKGTNVQIWTKGTTNNQKWKFTKVDGGSSNNNTNTNTEPEVKGPVEDGDYIVISGLNAGLALDITEASTKDGANLEVWTRYENQKNQQFTFKSDGKGYYTITSVNSGKVLDVYGNLKAAGTNVTQFQNNGQDNQKWKLVDAGNGYYYIESKSAGLNLDIYGGYSQRGTNVQLWTKGTTNNQKWKLKKYDPNNIEVAPSETISSGLYTIATKLKETEVLDVTGVSTANGANIELWENNEGKNQKFQAEYQNDGYYKLKALNSSKYLTVNSSNNVIQNDNNNYNNQKWEIRDAGNGYYNVISLSSGLFLSVEGSKTDNGTNVKVEAKNGQDNQKFKFTKTANEDERKKLSYTSYTSKYLKDFTGTLDENKYPGVAAKINALKAAHPNWNFKILELNVDFSSAVSGEHNYHGKSLVPKTYSSAWKCAETNGKVYEYQWNCASNQAIAYCMDARNFLDENQVFQFVDVNRYVNYSLDDINKTVSGTFLSSYGPDIINACKAQNVDCLYIISRLFQENGRSGSSTSRGMNDSATGKTYYNPFNIGAYGDDIIGAALSKAKEYGWDTMEKALEGGIEFCKANWLENCQNTFYLNKFDVDDTNGTGLYTHQYMANLLAPLEEGKSFRSMISNLGRLNENYTFIIPLYKNMSNVNSSEPKEYSEEFLINVEVTGDSVNFRAGASTSSTVIKTLDKGTILLSMARGVNSTWQMVMDNDGNVGYISDQYVSKIEDVKTCEVEKTVKTVTAGSGVNVRIGPGTSFKKINYVNDGDKVTVIDDKTYYNLDSSYNWVRIVLSNGSQGFMPMQYLK